MARPRDPLGLPLSTTAEAAAAYNAGLERLIHEPNTVTTRAIAQDAIVEAVRAYEPRILLDRVDVDAGADPRELIVTLSYRLKLTGAPARIEARVPVGGG